MLEEYKKKAVLNKKFVIILPFFNESDLILELIEIIESKIQHIKEEFILLFVNDGSTDNTSLLIKNHTLKSKNITLQVIELNGNTGHQNAIRQGLMYTNENYINTIKGVIIMDSDGEDNPDALNELVNKENFEVVFVSRGKRKEDLMFRFSYLIYKLIFKTITGKQINFGNYSMLSPKVLSSIADKHFFHYSAFISKQKFKIEKIQYNRNKRLKGKSKMNFKNLLLHALKSFIEYYEELIFFQVKVFVFILMIFISILGYVLYTKYVTRTALLGWSSNLLMGLINGLLIMFSSIIISTLLVTIKNSLDQKKIEMK